MTRRVLVTGVSSGIGLAQASLFLEKGYQVYGVDKARKPNLTGDFHFLQLDVTDELSPLFDWLPPCRSLFPCLSAGATPEPNAATILFPLFLSFRWAGWRWV